MTAAHGDVPCVDPALITFGGLPLKGGRVRSRRDRMGITNLVLCAVEVAARVILELISADTIRRRLGDFNNIGAW